MHAANPRLRMWQIAVVRGLVEAGRLDDARVHFEDLVALDGVHMRDNQMFLPGTCTLAEVAAPIDDPARAAVVQRALAPYATASPPAGSAGISIGPVSGYVGLAAEAAGDLDTAERQLRSRSCDVAFGTRPHEARARLALARVLARRGETAARRSRTPPLDGSRRRSGSSSRHERSTGRPRAPCRSLSTGDVNDDPRRRRRPRRARSHPCAAPHSSRPPT